MKIIPYLADNVFFVGPKTVDAYLHNGNFLFNDVMNFLRHTGDVQFAEELKAHIDELVKPGAQKP